MQPARGSGDRRVRVALPIIAQNIATVTDHQETVAAPMSFKTKCSHQSNMGKLIDSALPVIGRWRSSHVKRRNKVLLIDTEILSREERPIDFMAVYHVRSLTLVGYDSLPAHNGPGQDQAPKPEKFPTFVTSIFRIPSK
nr:hypothetical protein Iba_chr11aCG11440 [Ipomoea batatas]